ncbi:MAG: ROK family protein [Dysgonamonadaceae bacterium]|jgi:glucokinase|nr:ROK family protein [Dysgonamonadaceae bacterium]
MDKPYVIGIDVGGTNTVFGVVDARGCILESGKIKTGNYETAEAYVAVLAPELNKLIEKAGGKEKFNGIGIGAPNGNYYQGTIEDAPNVLWAKGKIIPFAKMIGYMTGIPAVLTNDANAAAIGEMTYGIAKGMKNFIMITLGTGVGSGIVVNGQLVYGHDGFAGELGHVIVRKENGRLCGCGRKGCLEAYASAVGVARTARQFIEERKAKTILTELVPDVEKITSKDVYDAAKKGDRVAIDIFQYTGRLLGEAFADFVAFSSPEAIVLFGGLARSGEFILNPIKEAMDEYSLRIFKGKTKVVLSELPESDAAVLGASALAWEIK